MSEEVTQSYNSYKPREAILKVLEDSKEPLSPFTIAEKTAKNHNTIRVYVKRMERQGEIRQFRRGLYCNIGTHGVQLPSFRLHNLCLSAICPWLQGKIEDVVEMYGETKLRVVFGRYRHKISIFLGGEESNKNYDGMDYDSVCFGLSRGFDVVLEKSEHSFPDSFTVGTFEGNRDFEKVRLDGVSCFTKSSLFQVLERLYQKKKGVRYEVKNSIPMSGQHLLALVQGGVSAINLQQLVFMVLQRNEELQTQMKFSNEKLVQVTELMRGILRRLDNGTMY